MSIGRLSVFLWFGSLFVACGPGTVNPQLKSQVDAAVTHVSGGRDVTTPSEGRAKPLASGQWVTYRLVDEKGEPTLLNYKIVGEEGDAFWMEYSIMSYYNVIAYKMLLRWDDSQNLDSVDIQRVIAKFDDEEPMEYDQMTLSMTKAIYKRFISLIQQEWDTTANQDVAVIAGRFTGCHKVTSEFYFGTRKTSEAFAHSEVPICGIVKSVGDSSTMELLAYGFEGATSTF